MSENEDKYHDNVLDLEARAKKNKDVVLKIGNSLQGMFMLGPKPMSFYDSNVKHSLGYENHYTLKKVISQNPKLYDASCFADLKIHVNIRDTEDILDDATKSQIKMNNKFQDPIAIEKKQNICTIDYKKLNALYEDFVPQKEFSAEQKYFSSSFIFSENSSNASSSPSSSETKPTVAPMPILKDQLLEAKLKHEIECCVLLSHECVNNNVQDEIEKIQRDSIEIQEGMQKRINILENDVQRCQKQSLDFELQLQHEKERRKCESSLKNVCETSWISKIEKLESENVSLEFQVQSLIKERENVKLEYQKLFDSIKKTRTQTQGEINELIEHVNQKTYAYAEIRAQNQDLLIAISELKAKLKNVEKGKSVNTKFDKANVSNKLLCVTPLNKQVFKRKLLLLKQKRNMFCQKQSLYRLKKKDVETYKNVIALGMYKVKIPKTQETITNKAKSVLPSTGLKAAFSVRRPSNRDSSFKNSVLTNTKNSSEKVEVFVMTNKKIYVASKNVVSNKEIVTDVDVVQIVLWIVDSGCSKHMTGDCSLLKNFVEKFIDIVCFGNDHFAAIVGYGGYVQGNIIVCHVYYVEGLGHNLFSVGKFCDRDLEVAFRSNTCYARNLEGDNFLIGARESNLYTISISDMVVSSFVCLLSKATSIKSWLWHRRLSHLNFGTINDLTKHDLVVTPR
ncbi:integrase, catalytic region, zinc finger, CCHC-type containing protein [Tanacetum coccineum]